ncbi:MAG TPA: IS630 transposase-related protein [Candidatus Babeliales bacterium]|nr:IS630 transposase-related protein [Candidatus Babeliales bacterium]
MPYSVDLRKRVIAAINEKMPVETAAKVFQLSRKVIYNWIDLQKETNSLEPKTGYQKGHSHKITDLEAFTKFVKNNQNCSLPKFMLAWEKLTGVKVSQSVMQRALKKIGYTSKKNV